MLFFHLFHTRRTLQFPCPWNNFPSHVLTVRLVLVPGWESNSRLPAVPDFPDALAAVRETSKRMVSRAHTFRLESIVPMLKGLLETVPVPRAFTFPFHAFPTVVNYPLPLIACTRTFLFTSIVLPSDQHSIHQFSPALQTCLHRRPPRRWTTADAVSA